jgi:hypothetical protein
VYTNLKQYYTLTSTSTYVKAITLGGIQGLISRGKCTISTNPPNPNIFYIGILEPRKKVKWPCEISSKANNFANDNLLYADHGERGDLIIYL